MSKNAFTDSFVFFQQNANGTKQKNAAGNQNNKTAKPKAKREEAAVMKLFEPQDDPLLSWCLVELDHLREGLDGK